MRIPAQVALTVCSDAPSLAHQVAICFAEILRQRPKSNYTVALSGGRVAVPFFNECAGLVLKDDLEQVHFFWADERCVPPDHQESNFALALKHLLAPLSVPAMNIHRIRGEAAPEAAAVEASKELMQVANVQEGSPILDLVILGMGEDGHVASLFPGDPFTGVAGEPVYRAVVASKPPPNRITLGYTAILQARHVWVLVAGANKTEAAKKALHLNEDLPLGRVLKHRPGTRIFITEDLIGEP